MATLRTISTTDQDLDRRLSMFGVQVNGNYPKLGADLIQLLQRCSRSSAVRYTGENFQHAVFSNGRGHTFDLKFQVDQDCYAVAYEGPKKRATTSDDGNRSKVLNNDLRDGTYSLDLADDIVIKLKRAVDSKIAENNLHSPRTRKKNRH